MGLTPGPTDFSFHIPQAAHERVDALLRQRGIGDARLAVIAPRGNWQTKHWPDEKSAAVARHFMSRGYAAVLVGAPRERAVGEAIARLAPGAVDLTGETSLSELAALIDRAAICITHDSGPMHLAVALGRPVVALFGPSDRGVGGALSSRQCGGAVEPALRAVLPAAARKAARTAMPAWKSSQPKR